MEKKLYSKICVHCRKEYKTPARGQRYCTPDCCRKHQLKKKGRRKEYEANREENLLISKAYMLSRQVAEHFLADEKKALEEANPGEKLELHHWDANPFNSSPWNLYWVTRADHEKIHSRIPASDALKALQEYQNASLEERTKIKNQILADLLKQPTRSKT